jgi:hypothetical protein
LLATLLKVNSIVFFPFLIAKLGNRKNHLNWMICSLLSLKTCSFFIYFSESHNRFSQATCFTSYLHYYPYLKKLSTKDTEKPNWILVCKLLEKNEFPVGCFEKCEEKFQDNEKSIFAWERTFMWVCLQNFNINRISLKEKGKNVGQLRREIAKKSLDTWKCHPRRRQQFRKTQRVFYHLFMMKSDTFHLFMTQGMLWSAHVSK